MLKNIFIIAMFMLSITAIGSDFKVGIGRKIITPQEPPIWMGGYASRSKPADGVFQDIWAKALVIESSTQNKVIIVTMDLHKFSRQMSEEVIKQITQIYGIERSQLILNVSHNHSGPMIWPNADMLDFKPVDQQAIFLYSQEIIKSLMEIVERAMKNLEPALLSSGHGEAFFGKNRRDPKLTYRPEDHDVPVLKIETPDGTLKA
ncbi:MAG: neutral/alkaline non-lysosomal ceramidase N-terminal domain-containing protein, partial [Bacteroidales bacterium]|nr:neutral/alkaline non-lysosomal ceramidase N-terminal domain-containing protein [Bacteroidales bacterium]